MASNIVRRRVVTIVFNILLVVVALWLALTPDRLVRNFVKRVDYIVYDLRFRLALNHLEKSKTPIVIVDIDEKSLRAEGRWPWPREKVAKLIQKIREQGALVIAFDVMFSEASYNYAKNLSKKLIKDKRVSKEFINKLKSLGSIYVDDVALAKALRGADAVLGIFFHDSAVPDAGLLPATPVKIPKDVQPADISLISLPGYTANLPILQNSAKSAGFLTTIVDQDGVIRRSPLLIRYKDSLYPSLALEAARLYLLVKDIQIGVIKIGDYNVLESIHLGNQKIPTDSLGQVIIPYRGPKGSFRYYSASDVLQGKLKPHALENALVFVGTSAYGLADIKAAPTDAVLPGVEIHASIAAGILENSFPFEPSWNVAAEIAIIIGIGLLLSIVMPLLSSMWLAFVSTFSLAALIVVDAWFWQEYGLLLSFTIPILLVIALAIVNLMYGFFYETRRRQIIRDRFGQYVPPSYVKQISENPDAFGFEGESKRLSILTTDIRNFTTISEKLDANRVKQLLNKYFTPMTEIVFNTRGTVDKYVGDMLMAFWGAPIEDDRHEYHALQTALDMLDESKRLQKEFAKIGLPAVEIGIGVNTGIVNVGDMGSKYRRSYTIIGDAVNLTSRMETLTKYYQVKIIVGHETKKEQDDFVFRLLDKIRVKGKGKAIRIYELICRRDDASTELLDELYRYHQAYDFYLHKAWQRALDIFHVLAEEFPDKNVYKIYIDRILRLKDEDLDQDWDGSVNDRRG